MPIGSFRLNTISAASAAVPEQYFLLYNSGVARDNNITPGGFDVDSSGNMYIFDMYSSKIAKLSPAGAILWQKYVSTPSTAISKGDCGLLSVDSNGQYLYYQLKETTTSIVLHQLDCSNGNLLSKSHNNVSAGNSIVVGNTIVGSDNTSIYINFGATVGGVARMVIKRYNLSSGLLPATAALTSYEWATGASPTVSETRMSYNPTGGALPIMVYYPGVASRYNMNPSRGTSTAISSVDSIAVYSTNTYFVRNNIISKYVSNFVTKSWERTHTVSSVGGSLYYNQGIVIDSSENIYSCYYNSTTLKVIIYKLNSSGTLQWTKSLYLGGLTDGIDGPALKLVGSNLYISFMYGSLGSGGMAILKIPTGGTLTKTFSNGFVLADETGSVASTSNLTVGTVSGLTTTAVTLTSTASTNTLSNASLTSFTKTVI